MIDIYAGKTALKTLQTKGFKPELFTNFPGARELLDVVFGSTGVQEIIDNPVFKAHFIVAKSKGFGASENKLIQGAGLLSSYILNRVIVSSAMGRYWLNPLLFKWYIKSRGRQRRTF